PVEVGRLAQALEYLLYAGALGRAQAARFDRLLHLAERRVAHLLPGREAVPQAPVRDVAVSVVGVLGEDGAHQLRDRVAVRLIHGPPVELAQTVADRKHAPAGGPPPGGIALRDPRWSRRRCDRRLSAVGEHHSRGQGHATEDIVRRRVAVGIETPMETGSGVVGGVSNYFRRLPGEGPPAVFIHGNPTHSEDWIPFLERMRGPALAPDLPGWGRSDHPPPNQFDYSMRGLDGFVTRFLERMAVGEHSLVVH